MDFPEPLSGMLRTFDWNAYLETANQISLNMVKPNTIPYLVVSEKHGPKIIGFIKVIHKPGDIEYNFNFVVWPDGRRITRTIPGYMPNAKIYELPPHIHDEMILANTLFAAFHTDEDSNNDSIMHAIKYLIDNNRTDYLKMTTASTSPLTWIMYRYLFLPDDSLIDIFNYIISFYTEQELNYRNYQLMNIARSYNPRFKNIIEHAYSKLGSLLYVLKKSNSELPAENIDQLKHYIGGKSKKRKNRKRRIKKSRRYI